mmetsp:Transcript_18949/g.44116  ORF Transcript_18949/g.44116 Transcript_18949/m.44116 type:complete len:435 (-) Transcript_18949:91-1395(-)
MVEVAQDLLDYVTYAGGIGRRRIDAAKGVGAGSPSLGDFDCAVLAEDPSDPQGPRITGLKELMFHEVLDRPFEHKSYCLQLGEFTYRAGRIIKQVDERLGEVMQAMSHNLLRRSHPLLAMVRASTDALRRAQLLICNELEIIWQLRFEPFFYPDVQGKDGTGLSFPNGWLDLDDMFLTANQLTRYVAELVALVDGAASIMPEEDLEPQALQFGLPHQALRGLVAAFKDHVPWLGVSIADGSTSDASSSAPPPLSPRSPTIGAARRLRMQHESSFATVTQQSRLHQAIQELDSLLTVHLNSLLSSIHSNMNQAFMLMVTTFMRWKRSAGHRAQRKMSRQYSTDSMGASESGSPQPPGSPLHRRPMGITHRSKSQTIAKQDLPLQSPRSAMKSSARRAGSEVALGHVAEDSVTTSSDLIPPEVREKRKGAELQGMD